MSFKYDRLDILSSRNIKAFGHYAAKPGIASDVRDAKETFDNEDERAPGFLGFDASDGQNHVEVMICTYHSNACMQCCHPTLLD